MMNPVINIDADIPDDDDIEPNSEIVARYRALAARDPSFLTALHYACEYMNELAVSALLLEKEDVAAKDSINRTPLHIACEKSNASIVRLLLLHNADAKAGGCNGNTPLHTACIYSRIDIVRILLSNDIDVNAKNNYSDTALHKACWSVRDFEIVKLLLSNGADINARNDCQQTPLYLAYLNSNTAVVQLLMSRKAIVDVDVFQLAVKEQDKSMIEAFLNDGGDVNAKDSRGDTALHVAVLCDCDISILILLILNGADVNIKDNDGDTALHAASYYCDNEDIFQLLLSNGADINAKNKHGDTPLHCACVNKHESLVPLTLLLQRVTDKNETNNAGVTPLNKAIQSHRFTVTLVLINQGAGFNPDPDLLRRMGPEPGVVCRSEALALTETSVLIVPGEISAVLDYAIQNPPSSFFLRYLFDEQNRKLRLHELVTMKSLDLLVKKLNLELDEGSSLEEKLFFYATVKSCQLERTGSPLMLRKANQIRGAMESKNPEFIFRTLKISETETWFWQRDNGVPVSLQKYKERFFSSSFSPKFNKVFPK